MTDQPEDAPLQGCRKCGKVNNMPFHTCNQTVYMNGYNDGMQAAAQRQQGVEACADVLLKFIVMTNKSYGDADIQKLNRKARLALALYQQALTQQQTAPDAWLDIASAPMDGSYIILYSPQYDGQQRIDFIYPDGQMERYQLSMFTHWQPLPPAPKQRTESDD